VTLDERTTSAPVPRGARKPSLWRRIRKPIQESRFFKNFVASIAVGYVRLVRWTNPVVAGSDDPSDGFLRNKNAIFAVWHGQHLFMPGFHPRGNPMATMISRSADAEINALYVEKLGLTVFRGSGGREREKAVEKGGIRGLMQMKKALDTGMSVGTVADIPNGTPRDAGMGVITLAKLSGRPIIPLALNTSRRKVLERTWDKTTINLPFGRSAFVFGEPIFVARDADEAELEAKRLSLTAILDQLDEQAKRLVDGAK